MYIVVDKHQRAALKFLVYVYWLFNKQMNKVTNMFNQNLEEFQTKAKFAEH